MKNRKGQNARINHFKPCFFATIRTELLPHSDSYSVVTIPWEIRNSLTSVMNSMKRYLLLVLKLILRVHGMVIIIHASRLGRSAWLNHLIANITSNPVEAGLHTKVSGLRSPHLDFWATNWAHSCREYYKINHIACVTFCMTFKCYNR